MQDTIEAIHTFWFGELDGSGLSKTDMHSLWFGASAETDAFCREQFGASLALALQGQLQDWAQTDRGLVALVVLLDQFSRNIHRGTAQAFAGDPIALALAQDAIASGRHLQLPAIHRVFLYLPLEHCENLAIQENSVALFGALANEAAHPQFDSFSRYAIAHRDVIARFGRFPHRNEALGREPTTAELAYLKEHGGF
ncbi:MAG: DUF924 domain-containing protein [Halioglobus sp.]|nr:DUF924 domain-containing protein [Halioglobus sp.]